MAGVKGRSGGPRANAGRKPKAEGTKKAAVAVRMEPQPGGGALKRSKAEPVPAPDLDMLTLLQEIALGRVEATAGQIRAAIAAVQYTHTKRADGGKKDEQAEKAKRAANRFAAPAPPRLAAAGGKKV